MTCLQNQQQLEDIAREGAQQGAICALPLVQSLKTKPGLQLHHEASSPPSPLSLQPVLSTTETHLPAESAEQLQQQQARPELQHQLQPQLVQELAALHATSEGQQILQDLMQHLWCLVPQQAQQQLLATQEDAVQSPAAQALHAPSTPSAVPLRAAGNSPAAQALHAPNTPSVAPLRAAGNSPAAQASHAPTTPSVVPLKPVLAGTSPLSESPCPLGESLCSMEESPCSPGTSLVHPDQAPAQPVGTGSQIGGTNVGFFSEESPAVHQVEHNPPLKRRLSKQQGAAKTQPAWKRRRVAAWQQEQQQQQQQHRDQEPTCHDQQQQQQQHEAQHSACDAHTMPLTLHEVVVDSILNSITQLGYLHSDRFGSQRLSPHH